MSESTQDVDRLIERLLSHPPEDPEGLEARLGEVSRELLRDRMVDRLIEGEFDEVHAAFIGQLLAFTGVGERQADLEQVVESPFQDATIERSRARVGAFAALMLVEEGDPGELAERLDLTMQEAQSLASAVFEATLQIGQFDPEVVRTYGEQLLEEPPGEREALFGELEQLRREAGLEAGLLYRRLIEDEEYRELWARLVEAVAEDGNPKDADWLQQRADELESGEETDEVASQMRRAAMKLRTEGLDDGRSIEGMALVGTCDGMGAFPVFLFLERPDRDRYIGLNLVIRAGSSSIRDGFQLTDMNTEGINELTAQVERDGVMELAEVPIDAAVGLLQRYLEETSEDWEELPGEIRDVVTRIERLPERKDNLPEIASAETVDSQVLEILAGDPMFESWFFEPTLLEGAGVPFPEAHEDPEAWIEEATQVLVDEHELAERLSAMCRHMAFWAHFGAVEGMDAQFAALAEQLNEDFPHTPLVEMMLGRTLDVVGELGEFGEGMLMDMMGDEELRAELHHRHLPEASDGEETTASYLDYMEMIFRTLELVRPELPAERQPRFDEIYELAGTLGRPLADLFCGRSSAPPAATFEHVATTLEETSLERPDLEWLVPTVLTHADMLADARGDTGFGT